MSQPKGLPDPDAPFTEPWHAQIFALTHKLAHAGHYTWPEWAERFAAQRSTSARAGARDAEATYYDDWLTTFEQLLIDRKLADSISLAKLKDAWAQAYLETPHGMPVALKETHTHKA